MGKLFDLLLERRLRDSTEVTVGSGRELTRADGEKIHAKGPMTSFLGQHSLFNDARVLEETQP